MTTKVAVVKPLVLVVVTDSCDVGGVGGCVATVVKSLLSLLLLLLLLFAVGVGKVGVCGLSLRCSSSVFKNVDVSIYFAVGDGS